MYSASTLALQKLFLRTMRLSVVPESIVCSGHSSRQIAPRVVPRPHRDAQDVRDVALDALGEKSLQPGPPRQRGRGLISLLIVAVFAALGINEKGITVLWWEFELEFTVLRYQGRAVSHTIGLLVDVQRVLTQWIAASVSDPVELSINILQQLDGARRIAADNAA